MMKEIFRDIVAFSAFGWALCVTVAADFAAKTGDGPAPSQIAQPIRASLSSKPIQVLEGDKTVFQIWFRNDLLLKSKPSSLASSLSSVAETTLVAAVSVEGSGLKDYKDNDIPKGIFTARFVMQPQDGDHLGTAEHNTFLVLIAIDADKAFDSFTKFTPLVKASGKLTSSGHPLIISLRPISSVEGRFPAVTEPASEHKALRLKLPAKTPDGEATELAFELVFQGHGHIQ